MLYHITRDGQSYGPYTLEDLHRYIASGNILPTDLVKSDEMAEWIPVSQLVGAQPLGDSGAGATGFATGAAAPGTGWTQGWSGLPGSSGFGSYASDATGAQPLYADPPNLHWVLVLVLGICTCGLFTAVWEIVQAVWMRRVHPRSNAIFYYIGNLIVSLLSGFSRRSLYYSGYNGYGDTYRVYHGYYPGLGFGAGLLAWLLLELAWFDMRRSMLEHYNTCEPIGLRLSPILTFFFGPLYFQYHLSRINQLKQQARLGGAAI